MQYSWFLSLFEAMVCSKPVLISSMHIEQDYNAWCYEVAGQEIISDSFELGPRKPRLPGKYIQNVISFIGHAVAGDGLFYWIGKTKGLHNQITPNTVVTY